MEMNENVEMITGDPKKAINKLVWPLIASMLLVFLNNIIDGIWVAGLGPGPSCNWIYRLIVYDAGRIWKRNWCRCNFSYLPLYWC